MFVPAEPSLPQKRLLLISYHLPPSRAVGALRWQKLARYASEYGWAIDAVTLSPADLKQVDQDASKDLPRSMRVMGVPAAEAPWEPMERAVWGAYRKVRRRTPTAGGGAGGGSSTQLVSDSFTRQEVPRFPRSGADWRRAYQACTALWRERRWAHAAAAVALAAFDRTLHKAVITCGPPHMTHEAGRLVAERTGVPFVMDLRDPWFDVERLHEALASSVWWWAARRFERRCVQSSSLVVMNSERARAALASRYPAMADRVITVMNGCDDEVLPESPKGGPFRVVYAGSVYLDRDPRPLIKAAGQVVRDMRLTPDQFRLEFAGDVASYCGVPLQTLAAAEGMADYVRLRPHLPRRELLEMLSGAAVLVSLPQDSHLAIPSKIFEYMGFRAWLLAFAAPDSATALVLDGSGADVIAPGDVEATTAMLRRRFTEYQDGRRPEPLASQSRFTRKHQAGILFESLADVTGFATAPSTDGMMSLARSGR